MPLPRFLLRPGTDPTHDDPEGGQRWHYLTPAGEKLDPPAFLYQYQGHATIKDGWWGEVGTEIIDPGGDPRATEWDLFDGPESRKRIQERMELLLVRQGYTILVRPEWVQDVESETEAWTITAMIPVGLIAIIIRWEASVYWFPGHASRRARATPHWCAQALITDDGSEIELKDRGEYGTREEAQKAALDLVRAAFGGLLATVPG